MRTMFPETPIKAPDTLYDQDDGPPTYNELNPFVLDDNRSLDDGSNSSLVIAVEESDYTFDIMASYLLSVMVLGVAGNSAVIYTFARCKKLHNPTNLLIANLSASDLMVAACGTPLSTISTFSRRWQFGQTGCDFYGFINYYCGCISLNTLALISLFRYIIIVRGGSRRVSLTLREALYATAGIHVYTLIFSTPPLYGWNRFLLTGLRFSCDIDFATKTPLSMSYVCYMFVFLFFIPLGMIVWSYWHIYLLLARHTEAVAKAASAASKAKEAYLNGLKKTEDETTMVMMVESEDKESKGVADPKKTRRPCRMKLHKVKSGGRVKKHYPVFVLLVTIIVFLVAWLPYCVVSLWVMIGDPSEIPLLATTIPTLFAKSCVIYNPIIYVLLNPQFRRGLKRSLSPRILYSSSRGSTSPL